MHIQIPPGVRSKYLGRVQFMYESEASVDGLMQAFTWVGELIEAKLSAQGGMRRCHQIETHDGED